MSTMDLEAMKLSINDHARLAQKQFDSLDDVAAPEERDRLWLEEAGRRGSQIDSGEVTPVPAEEVDRKARALLG